MQLLSDAQDAQGPIQYLAPTNSDGGKLSGFKDQASHDGIHPRVQPES